MAIKKINEWDTNPNDNDFVPAEGGWPELMTRSGVNDASRINLSELRQWYNDSEWIQVRTVGPDPPDIGVFARISETECQINLAGNDLTGFFTAGRIIKIIDGGPGGSSDLVTQVASSSYNNPITTINILSTAEMHAAASDVYTHSSSVLRALGLVDASASFYIPLTPDSAGINAAISLAFSAGGGTVFLLAETYAITATIDLLGGKVILAGSGPETILSQSTAANLDKIISLGSTFFPTTLRDFRIDVNRGTNPTGLGIGIEIDGQVRARMDRLTILGSETGIRITSQDVQGIVIRDCVLASYQQYGIASTASTDAHRGSIIGCVFDGEGVTGVAPAAIKLAGMWQVVGNTLGRIGHASLGPRGIWLWNKVANDTGGRESSITANFVDGGNSSSGTCIEIGGDQCAVTGNVIDSPTSGKGIYFNSTQAGQTLVDCTASGNAVNRGSPIVMNQRTRALAINGNTCRPGSGLVGIEDDGDFNLISNNVIEDGLTGIKAAANSTNSTIRANVITFPSNNAVEIVGTASKALIDGNTLECGGNGVLVSATATDPIIKRNEIRSATTGINITSGCLRAVIRENDTTDAGTPISDAGTDTNRLGNSFDLSIERGRKENDLAVSSEQDVEFITALDMPCGGKSGTFLFESFIAGRSGPTGNDVTIRLYCGVNGTMADTLVRTYTLKSSQGAEFDSFEFAAVTAYTKWGISTQAPATENVQVVASVAKISQD